MRSIFVVILALGCGGRKEDTKTNNNDVFKPCFTHLEKHDAEKEKVAFEYFAASLASFGTTRDQAFITWQNFADDVMKTPETIRCHKDAPKLKEGHEEKSHFKSVVNFRLLNPPHLTANSAPFNKPYYKVSATHTRHDIYFQPAEQGATEVSGCPRARENGVMEVVFSGENWVERNQVNSEQEWRKYVVKSEDGEHGAQFLGSALVPQHWAEPSEVNNTSWKVAFSNFETFKNTFQISIPPADFNWPTKQEGHNQTATDCEKIDTCLGLELGTTQNMTDEWDKVSAEILTLIGSADGSAMSEKRYQPAFAGSLYFTFADKFPSIFVVIAANGSGVAQTLYANKVARSIEDQRWASGTSGFKFSPCGAANNYYTFSNVANEGQFTFSIKVFYSNYPPKQWWEEGDEDKNQQILTVDIHMEGKDELEDHWFDFMSNMWAIKLANKGLVMQAIMAKYYPNDSTIQQLELVTEPDGDAEQKPAWLDFLSYAGIRSGRFFLMRFIPKPQVVNVPAKRADVKAKAGEADAEPIA